jgi:TonB family protein
MPEAAARALLERYAERLVEIDHLLLEGNARAAYRRAEDLGREMMHSFMGGPAVEAYLGTVTTLRAIAAYQLGRPDEALWHWYVACQLSPRVATYQMTAYGEAGPFLKENIPRDAAPGEEGPRSPDDEASHLDDDRIEPPRKRRTVSPEFPFGKLGNPDVEVVVEAIIDKQGRVRNPRIATSHGELTLVYAVLEALRQWEFEPGTLDGEPVNVYYTLTVRFD